MKKINKIRFDIQFFAEGNGTSGTASDGATGENATVAVSQNEGEAAQSSTQDASAKDIRTQYEEDIKGRYKELDDARIQGIINKRLKSSRATVEKYEKLSPVLEMVAKKYGVDAKDTDALIKALDEDDYFLEDEALAQNVSTDYLRGMRKMERENFSLRRQVEAQQQREAEEQKARQYAEWDRQAALAKQFYPMLDIKKELENPRFRAMLSSGVEVKAAYEALHINDIIPAAMQYTAKATEQKVVNKIIAGEERPDENGISAGGASKTKMDVSKLTKEERQNLIQRVANGERITFD